MDIYSPITQCPYDPNHQVKVNRLQHHLLKCRENHPDADFVICDFNATHHVPRNVIRSHHKTCSDRPLYDTKFKTEFERLEGILKDPVTEFNNFSVRSTVSIGRGRVKPQSRDRPGCIRNPDYPESNGTNLSDSQMSFDLQESSQANNASPSASCDVSTMKSPSSVTSNSALSEVLFSSRGEFSPKKSANCKPEAHSLSRKSSPGIAASSLLGAQPLKGRTQIMRAVREQSVTTSSSSLASSESSIGDMNKATQKSDKLPVSDEPCTRSKNERPPSGLGRGQLLRWHRERQKQRASDLSSNTESQI